MRNYSYEVMRSALMHNTKYSGSSKWHAKVQHMSDSQVLAMYKRLESSGGLKSKKI